jgi:hypothetical protein
MWEYLVITFDTTQLNPKGALGWDLIAVTSTQMIFKRFVRKLITRL